ncbi:FxsA family protein [Alteromonas aestuariivivens]|uniref:FxsA family protein n=1 Tax=Alteromonas aestuariivivens TaxID=1938339 RepID=A0A3D8M588_9ALTE|nr:FxsA family protein [Alteromonas aestuariivivens]RDV24903.1 FxsA family protein [Alteromonas aestuariivivens]
MRVLFLLFALLPILEIAVLVHVGGIIGGWNTIALVLFTAFIGAFFVRQEGLSTLQSAQRKMQRNEIPGGEMLEGLMLVIAGVLLVTPGFITDILGLCLVLPPSRKWIARHAARHMSMRVVTAAQYHQQPSSQGFKRSSDSNVIEGEYTDRSGNDNSRLR